MMRWLLLLLVVVTVPPAAGEEIGAKAMFGDPSLDVIHLSPHHDAAPPPGRAPAVEPVEKKGPTGRPQSPPGPPDAPAAPRDVSARIAEPPRSIGIRSWVQRVDDKGKVLAEMEVGRIFRSGERIQLLVESNTEGYLAVVQQGADGRAGLLFPPHESELGAGRIPAHVKVVLPGTRHSFTFDEEAGTERLLIVLVRDRQELAALPLRREMGPADVAAVRRLAMRELGAKNLVIEAFADPEEDPALYTVNRTGNAIVQEIALVHER